MAACNFCGIEIPKGTGKIYVKKDGKTFNFCSSKCEKNMLVLKRKPWEIKWTKSARDSRGSQK
ncbi:MAG: 50S ribosomal protein L24e [Nanoarchaeota archaeon]